MTRPWWALFVFALVAAIALTTATRKEVPVQPLTTNWIGHPVVSDNDRYTPSQGWLTGVQVGLRSDGVVVWRKAE